MKTEWRGQGRLMACPVCGRKVLETGREVVHEYPLCPAFERLTREAVTEGATALGTTLAGYDTETGEVMVATPDGKPS